MKPVKSRRHFSKFMPITDRIKASVLKQDGCWLWTKGIDTNGYATVPWGGKSRSVHRISYEAFKGKIPVGLEIDHLCRTKRCVNPEHLEAVTHQENMARHYGKEKYMKSGRLDLRLTKAEKIRIIKGAKKVRQSMAAFTITAVLEKSDAVLGLGSYAK